MDLTLAAFLNWALRKKQGVNDLTNLVDSRLTTQRAANLDNLRFIQAGTVAGQAKIGTPSDPAAVNSTLFALIQACQLFVCDIEAKARQIAASQAQSITVTANTVTEQSYVHSWGAPLLYIAGGFANNLVTTVATFGTSSYPSDAGGVSGSTVQYLTGQDSAPFTQIITPSFSPTTPQQTLTPSSLITTIVPGISLPPLGGCAGTVAGGVRVTLAGYKPNASQATMFPFTLGNPLLGSGDYIGLKWDNGTQQFYLSVRTASGTLSNVPIPSTVDLYPCTITWSSTGVKLVANDQSSYTVSAGNSPATTVNLQGYLNQNGASYLTYANVGYV